MCMCVHSIVFISAFIYVQFLSAHAFNSICSCKCKIISLPPPHCGGGTSHENSSDDNCNNPSSSSSRMNKWHWGGEKRERLNWVAVVRVVAVIVSSREGIMGVAVWVEPVKEEIRGGAHKKRTRLGRGNSGRTASFKESVWEMRQKTSPRNALWQRKEIKKEQFQVQGYNRKNQCVLHDTLMTL